MTVAIPASGHNRPLSASARWDSENPEKLVAAAKASPMRDAAQHDVSRLSMTARPPRLPSLTENVRSRLMNVLLFGATGMVGQGVLRECLLDPDVKLVRAVGRTATGVVHPKLRETIRADLWNYASIEADLSGFDACFFCLGVSSAGMSEQDYDRLTYRLTLAAAETLARLNPQMTFIYVSGVGTDSSEGGRVMWARIKGKTENALLRLAFKGAYMFRPGAIEPLHGAKSKTASYRFFYALARPVLPALRRAFPNHILTTEQIGRAMLNVSRHGGSTRILGSKEIRSAARAGSL
jgi:uncharacterized protein YbjT (DUF2867 family)